MEYKNKYLKYKNKYYDFVIDKKMEGGNPLINIPIGIGIAGIVGYISNKLFCNSNEIEEYLKNLSNILNLKTDTLLKLTNIVEKRNSKKAEQLKKWVIKKRCEL